MKTDPTMREMASPRNSLLQSLPARQFEEIAHLMEPVTLTPRRTLQHANVPIKHVYFIEEGLVSVLASTDTRNAVEVWLVGREGVVGSAAVLGLSTTPLRYLVQIGGSALRIERRRPSPSDGRPATASRASARRPSHHAASQLAIHRLQPQPFVSPTLGALVADRAGSQQTGTSFALPRICSRAFSACGVPPSRRPSNRSRAVAFWPGCAA